MTPSPLKRLAFGAGSLFALIFLFELHWIFQGLDVTDSGFHLTNQVASFTGRVNEVAPLMYLTDFVGGMWLSIPDEPSLFWARLGGVLLYSTNATLSFLILVRHFAPCKVFIAVLCSSLFLTTWILVPLIHYFTLPSTLLIVGAGLLDQLLARSPGSLGFRVYACLLGALPIPLFFCRFSLLPIVVPLVVVLYCVIAREAMTELRQAAPYLAFGLLASALGLGFFFFSTGFLEHYLAHVGELFARDSTIAVKKGWIKRYFVDYAHVARYTAVGCVALLAVALLRDRIISVVGRTSLRIAVVGVLVIAWTVVLFALHGPILTHDQLTRAATVLDQSFQFVLFFLIGLTLLVSLLFLVCNRGQSLRIRLLLVVTCTMMVVSPFGSGSGIRKSIHGMWVALPLMLLVADRLRLELDRSRLTPALSAFAALGPLLAILGVGLHCTMVHRDDWRPVLTQEFRHKHLRHIYSEPTRVRVVDEVLAEIDRRTEKGDLTLMLGPLQLFYYLTETQPALGSMWLGAWTPEGISRKYHEAVARGRYPTVLVISKVSTRSRDWRRAIPGKRVPGESEKLEFLRQKLVDDHRYKLVWENAVFSIYSPPREKPRASGAMAAP